MAKNRHLRRRPSTPDLKLAQRETPPTAVDPTSPPETPTTSPHATRKSSHKPRHQPPPFHEFHLPSLSDNNILPLGHGHLFSYQPRLGPEELSPRSASSSSDADDESGSVGSSLHAEANIGSSPEQSEGEEQQCRQPDAESEASSDDEDSIVVTATRLEAELVVEEIDPMDSDYEGLDTLFPNDTDSNRSRSGTRPDLDGNVLDHLRKLNCSNEASDEDAQSTSSSSSSSISRDSAEIAFYKRQAELKRIRRVSMSSSLGKRTHSELSGDSDGDSTANDASDLPSSARRMRKRLHRTSLLFQDPPAPRIDELEEPDSSEDERRFAAGLALAHELPYFDIEVVEIEST